MDWSALFAFDVSPMELIVRGTLMYWFLFLVFRFVLQRDIGSVGVADVLLIVLVADASQNASRPNTSQCPKASCWSAR